MATTTTMTAEQSARLAEIIGKMASGSKLTPAEGIELVTLNNAQQATMRAVKVAAEEQGIVLATDSDSKVISTIAEGYYWQVEGNQAWHTYRLEKLAGAYNTFAVKHKLEQCHDLSELGRLLEKLPTIFTSAVDSGRSEARRRYNSQWTKELRELAKMRGDGSAIGRKPKQDTSK